MRAAGVYEVIASYYRAQIQADLDFGFYFSCGKFIAVALVAINREAPVYFEVAFVNCLCVRAQRGEKQCSDKFFQLFFFVLVVFDYNFFSVASKVNRRL